MVPPYAHCKHPSFVSAIFPAHFTLDVDPVQGLGVVGVQGWGFITPGGGTGIILAT